MDRKTIGTMLVDGLIPANTECPFTSECTFKQAGVCKHLGVAHSIPFSCASARGFDLMQ